MGLKIKCKTRRIAEMNFKKGEIVELNIVDLAFGGAGVAKLGDLAVFVEQTVPGDKILARLTRIKSSYAEAKLKKLLAESGERVKARCKHFGVCGGCSLQNLNYENQLKWKWKMVSDAVSRIGGFRDAKIEPIIGCEFPWFYRNKMEYSFGTLNPPASQFSPIAQPCPPLSGATSLSISLGLHPSGNFRSVFNLEECFLQSELSVKIVRAVRQWAQENNLGADVLRNLIVREGKNTGEVMVNLVTHGEGFSSANDLKEWITSAFPKITSLYRTAVTVCRGFKTVSKEFLLYGKPYLTETLNIYTQNLNPQTSPLTFEIAPQAFFQPNTFQAEILYGKVLEFAAARILRQAQDDSNQIALDLFCGTGTIGLALAKSCKQVFGVELNESAVESARQNAKKNNIKNIEFLCGDVGKLLPHLEKLLNPPAHRPPAEQAGTGSHPPTLLITDPPRAGIDQKTLLKILALKIPKWIYVSCNPTTLARDLKIAGENGYKLQKIQPVDMFPHTYHVETVCLLTL